MDRYSVRKEEMKQRIDSLEKKREMTYNEMAALENEIDDLCEKMMENQERVAEYKKQGEVLSSYMEFLENQLVIEALQKRSYSIEHFDLFEKGRLTTILREGDDIRFDWYVNKKKEGYEFNQIEPLHKILKEDYEDFCTRQLEK